MAVGGVSLREDKPLNSHPISEPDQRIDAFFRGIARHSVEVSMYVPDPHPSLRFNGTRQPRSSPGYDHRPASKKAFQKCSTASHHSGSDTVSLSLNCLADTRDCNL